MVRALFTVMLLSLLTSLSFAQEQLTISTYYPSPYGYYHELETDFLTLNPQASLLGASCDKEGKIAYKTSDQVYICKGSPLTWQALSSKPQNCTLRSQVGSGVAPATATCLSGEYLLNGGGSCSSQAGVFWPILVQSQPLSLNSWQTDCLGLAWSGGSIDDHSVATAYAICCK